MFAELAITDNNVGTLEKVIKANPWHLEALKMITGSRERAHLPLRQILYEDMGGLIHDATINVRGITKGGQFLDTQGYIAHNNELVVVAFRCTTTVFDWMTNFNSSTSAWELDEDLAQGYSGFCSGLDGLCCQGANYKPRVHTGFYNNFLAALPTIRRYVDQFLAGYERPRTLYVVGHSLGAGIANLTATYFLLENNWKLLPQSLVLVTAGSPRSVCTSMRDVVGQKLVEYGPRNVRFHRIVKGNDVVVSVPPKFLGFAHLSDPVVIMDDGQIVFRNKDADIETDISQVFTLTHDKDAMSKVNHRERRNDDEDDDDDDDSETADEETTTTDPEEKEVEKYNRMVSRIPKALRDHMPDFYLKPIFQRQGIACGTLRHMVDPESSHNDGTDEMVDKEETVRSKKGSRKSWVPKVFRREKVIKKVEPTYF